MAAGVVIQHKRKAGPFVNGELAAGELGLDVTNSKFYTSNDGATVYLIDAIGILALVDDTTPQLGGDLDAQSFRVFNLPAPAGGSDPATKAYADSLFNGTSWREPVLAIQVDGTLDPGGSPTEGDRYIITDSGSLNGNFGSIAGIGDDDIVEYDGADFVVSYDASAEGEGAAVYDKTSNLPYTLTDAGWAQTGGQTDHGSQVGLLDDDHTQYTIILSGATAPGSAPPRVGALYVNTATRDCYIGTGTSTSADWARQINDTSTLNNPAMVIDGGTI